MKEILYIGKRYGEHRAALTELTMNASGPGHYVGNGNAAPTEHTPGWNPTLHGASRKACSGTHRK